MKKIKLILAVGLILISTATIIAQTCPSYVRAWVIAYLKDSMGNIDTVYVNYTDSLAMKKLIADWGDIDTLNCDTLYCSGGVYAVRVYISNFVDVDSTNTDHFVCNDNAVFSDTVFTNWMADKDSGETRFLDDVIIDSTLYGYKGQFVRADSDTVFIFWTGVGEDAEIYVKGWGDGRYGIVVDSNVAYGHITYLGDSISSTGYICWGNKDTTAAGMSGWSDCIAGFKAEPLTQYANMISFWSHFSSGEDTLYRIGFLDDGSRGAVFGDPNTIEYVQLNHYGLYRLSPSKSRVWDRATNAMIIDSLDTQHGVFDVNVVIGDGNAISKFFTYGSYAGIVVGTDTFWLAADTLDL